MHTNGAIKTLILICVGLLIGVCCYAAFSGTLSPQQDPEQQENDNMEDGDKVVQLNDTLIQEIEAIADYYDMTMDEAIEFLLKIGINEQLGFIEQAKAWDKHVKEMNE